MPTRGVAVLRTPSLPIVTARVITLHARWAILPHSRKHDLLKFLSVPFAVTPARFTPLRGRSPNLCSSIYQFEIDQLGSLETESKCLNPARAQPLERWHGTCRR